MGLPVLKSMPSPTDIVPFEGQKGVNTWTEDGPGQVSFGPFSLDSDSMRVSRDGFFLKLRPQAFLALKALIKHNGLYVPYERLIHEAWGGNLVSRHTVATTIGAVRIALGEYGSWISYRPKLGYRLRVPGCDDLIRAGWHLWNRRTCESLEKALNHFERAAELHAQWHKVKAAQSLADELVQPIPNLRAIIIQKAAQPTSEPDQAENGNEVVILSAAKNPRILSEAPQPSAPNSDEPEAAVFLLHSGCLLGPEHLSTLGVRAVKEQTSVGSSLFAQPLMLQAIPLDEPLKESLILGEACSAQCLEPDWVSIRGALISVAMRIPLR